MSTDQIAKTAPAANQKFQQWAEDQNPDIGHWAARWNEGGSLKNFSMISIPHQIGQPFNKAKFGDFWRFW